MSREARIWPRVATLFDELLELPPDERRHRLEQVESSEIRDWAERLLQAHEENDNSILDRALDEVVQNLIKQDSDNIGVIPEKVSGLMCGNWRTLEEIGRGGMAVVLRGERADGQFEKEVAIKLLPPGPVTPKRRDRFLAEIQTLARLEHPNIAHLIDGGIDESGIPYLVMEYVDGLSIDQYCTQNRLGLQERVRLFIQVTEAVAFSHKKLIVHGDIKPNNVMVTSDGQIKLVDFGVASILSDPHSDHDLPIGVHCSPAYAAPERLDGARPDIAQDIFALGAVLYQLLTGRRIRDARETTSALLGQPRFKPAPPLYERAKAVSQTPFSAARLRGDLEAICARALANDPEQRYETASSFRTDLRDWLALRPVDAVDGGKMYRVGKWLRRHWLPATAAGMAIATLIAGTAVSQWQAKLASEAATEAQQQSEAALAAQQDAERAQARAIATRDFLVDLFKSTLPNLPPEKMPDTESLLAEGARRAETAEGLAPALRADMLSAIGNIYRVRGQHDEAHSLLDQARELAATARETAPEVYARTLFAWSEVLVNEEQTNEAIQLLEDLIEFLEQNAPDSAVLLEARYELGWKHALVRDDERALEIMEEVDREVRGRDDVTDQFKRRLKTSLGITLYTNGRYRDAQPIYEEAIKIEERLKGEEHREVAVKLANAAINDTMLGRFEDANSRYQRALRIHHEIGDMPSQTHAAAHASYAMGLAWQGQVDEALEQQREGIRKSAEFQGLESPEDLLLRDYRIGSILFETQRLDQAEPYLQRALRDLSESDGYGFVRILALRALAQARCVAGDSTSGYKHLERVHANAEERQLPPRVEASILEAEAHCKRAAGEPEAAFELLQQAAEIDQAMAPGAAAARARRQFLRARLLADTDQHHRIATALQDARHELEAVGLESHPLMADIDEFQQTYIPE